MKRNKYLVLGITPTDDAEIIRSAYKEAVLRFHPDINPAPDAADEFLEIQSAFEVLNDSNKKAAYDEEVIADRFKAPIKLEKLYSRNILPHLDESQLVYTQLNISCNIDPEQVNTSPLAIALVIDRSTSMQGERMDQVKSSIIGFIQQLGINDVFSVIAFSDRAEVIIPTMKASSYTIDDERISMITTNGGTEIFYGLAAGMEQLESEIGKNCQKHILLFTDGQTYGDEEHCFELAVQALEKKVVISAFGLGYEWNDKFLDQLSALTGSNAEFITSSNDLEKFLHEKLITLGLFFSHSVNFDLTSDPGVELSYSFRIRPDSAQLESNKSICLGNVPFLENLSVILEFLVPPLSNEIQMIKLAHGFITLESPYWEAPIRLFVQLDCPVRYNPEVSYPPPEIVQAMSQLVLYRIQEKARAEVDKGNITAAFKRLQYLASHLMSQGNKDLARIVLREAQNIQHNKQFSNDGDKKIKYGTRAFLLTDGKGITV